MALRSILGGLCQINKILDSIMLVHLVEIKQLVLLFQINLFMAKEVQDLVLIKYSVIDTILRKSFDFFMFVFPTGP